MATLTVRNLEDEVVRALRMKAAANGRSAEAEHREILRAALTGNTRDHRRAVSARLAEFRERTAGRGSASSTELLRESREMRMRRLVGDDPPGE